MSMGAMGRKKRFNMKSEEYAHQNVSDALAGGGDGGGFVVVYRL